MACGLCPQDEHIGHTCTDCKTCPRCWSGNCKQCPMHLAELAEFRDRTEGNVSRMVAEILYPRTQTLNAATVGKHLLNAMSCTNTFDIAEECSGSNPDGSISSSFVQEKPCGSIPHSAEDNMAEKVSLAESNDYDSPGVFPVSQASARIFLPLPQPRSALAYPPIHNDYTERAGVIFTARHPNMPATTGTKTMFGDGENSLSPPPYHQIITVTAERKILLGTSSRKRNSE